MKKSTSGSKGPSFSACFSAISAVISVNQTSAAASATSAFSARKERLVAIRDHIAAGGTLTAAQFKKLSAPEQAYVKAVELGNNPDVQAAAQQIGDGIKSGLAGVSKGLKGFFGTKKK